MTHDVVRLFFYRATLCGTISVNQCPSLCSSVTLEFYRNG